MRRKIRQADSVNDAIGNRRWQMNPAREGSPLENPKSMKTSGKLDKESINIVRTLQRNNVQLIHVADNKAAILLSLNAIMLTLLIPNVISNLDFILENLLYVPVLILAGTSLCTVCISAFILMPTKFKHPPHMNEHHHTKNPFYFGNIFNMEYDLFFEKLNLTLKYKKDLQEFLAQDLFYSGHRLGFKMKGIRLAFFTFIIGISLASVTTLIAGIIKVAPYY